MVLLELGGKISSDLAFLLKGKVLRAVFGREAVDKDLVFCAEIVLKLVEVSREIVVGGNMADQDRVVAFNWGALLFKTEVRVQVVDNPGAVIRNFFRG